MEPKSPTAIKKAQKQIVSFKLDFINDDLYLKINPDIIILSEIIVYSTQLKSSLNLQKILRINI